MPTKIVLSINGSNPFGNGVPALGFSGSGHSYAATESFWIAGGISQQLYTWLRNNVGPKRAAILAGNCEVTSARLYQGGGGRGLVFPLGNPGALGPLNQANDAILFETGSADVQKQRQAWIHFPPDGEITNGEFRPTQFYQLGCAQWLALLASSGSWYAQVQSSLTSVVSITTGGLVTFAAVNPFAVGNRVKFTRVYIPAEKRKIGGTFTVLTIGPLANQCTIAAWPQKEGAGGKAFIPTTTLRSLGSGEGLRIVRAGTKRVGRPTDLYRGRKSTKR